MQSETNNCDPLKRKRNCGVTQCNPTGYVGAGREDGASYQEGRAAHGDDRQELLETECS